MAVKEIDGKPLLILANKQDLPMSFTFPKYRLTHQVEPYLRILGRNDSGEHDRVSEIQALHRAELDACN